jgi:hypothetical protein
VNFCTTTMVTVAVWNWRQPSRRGTPQRITSVVVAASRRVGRGRESCHLQWRQVIFRSPWGFQRPL